MQTTITITGQISGNLRLLSAIQTFDSEVKKTIFYGYQITFRTKKQAKKALWDAYKWMRNEEPVFKHGITYGKSGYLSYDASKAKIN